MSRKPGTSKSKGSSFERETAKLLSTWMFGDQYVLGRDPTSGARGTILKNGSVYAGDIVPVKQLPSTVLPDGKFPFLFELKTGYRNDIPTLFQQNIIRKWVRKLIGELTEEQLAPILILRFHYQKPMMLMPFKLRSIAWEVCLNIPVINHGHLLFYSYPLEDVLIYNFEEIYAELA